MERTETSERIYNQCLVMTMYACTVRKIEAGAMYSFTLIQVGSTNDYFGSRVHQCHFSLLRLLHCGDTHLCSEGYICKLRLKDHAIVSDTLDEFDNLLPSFPRSCACVTILAYIDCGIRKHSCGKGDPCQVLGHGWFLLSEVLAHGWFLLSEIIQLLYSFSTSTDIILLGSFGKPA